MKWAILIDGGLLLGFLALCVWEWRRDGRRMKTKLIVQLAIRTNIPHLNDVEDPPALWADTAYINAAEARKAWPQEVYREVKVKL